MGDKSASLIFGYTLLHYYPLHWAWCVHNVSTLVPKQHLQPHVLFKINIEWMWFQLVMKWGHCNCGYSRSLGNDLDNSYHGCVGAFMLWEIWPLKTEPDGQHLSSIGRWWTLMVDRWWQNTKHMTINGGWISTAQMGYGWTRLLPNCHLKMGRPCMSICSM